MNIHVRPALATPPGGLRPVVGATLLAALLRCCGAVSAGAPAASWGSRQPAAAVTPEGVAAPTPAPVPLAGPRGAAPTPAGQSLPSALSPAAPWLSVALAALGGGDARLPRVGGARWSTSAAEGTSGVPRGPGAGPLLVQVERRRDRAAAAGVAASENHNLVKEVFSRLVSRTRTLYLAAHACATKASIAGKAVLEALRGSASAASRDGAPGAWLAVATAVGEAQEASAEVDLQVGRQVSQGAGLLLALLLIVTCWVAELLLTQRLEAPDRQASSPLYIDSLGFVRFLFAWHLVFDNFYQTESEISADCGAWALLARWGNIAVPFFFLASGFVNTYEKLISDPKSSTQSAAARKTTIQEDAFFGMLRRVSQWWPFYALALSLCAVQWYTYDAEEWTHYVADLLLISGLIWTPHNPNGIGVATATGWPYLYQDQYLCFLMVYLLTLPFGFDVLNECSDQHLWFLMVMCVWITVPSSLMEWYFFTEGFAPFNLVQMFPSFVFGQSLACWFVRHCLTYTRSMTYEPRPVQDLHWCTRFGVTFGFVVISIMFFSFSPYDKLPILKKDIFVPLFKGGLLPLLGMIMVGLAAGSDPLAKLFARRPFRWGSRVTMATFLFQVPAIYTYQEFMGYPEELTWGACAWLLVASVSVHYFLERPYRKALGFREK